MANLPAHKEDLGQLGPATRSLPNNRWRAFAEFYVLDTYTGDPELRRQLAAASAYIAGRHDKTTP